MKLAAITDWLAEAGLRSLSLDDIVDGFARRLNEVGVPVARIFAGMNTLHPMVRARSLIWDRATGPATRFEFRHVEIDAPILRESPFAPMILHGIAERRYDLTSPKPEHEVPLFEELRAAGMTDWLGRVFPFGELSPQIGGPADAERVGELWLVCSVTTDRPGGFADTHVAALRELLPVFALAAKATAMRAIYEGLLAAYLGQDPAARILSGTVQRGEVQSVEAVLFFTDLRGFTALADTLPGRDLILLLDDCFDCMVRPGHRARRRGPEIPGRRAARDLPDRGQAARRDLRRCARGGQGGAGADGEPGRDAPRPVAADARPRHRAACR